MTDFDNNLRGVLFKNDRKEKDTHPDYKGSCEIEGQEYWISAWIKANKDGSKRMSLAFQLKEGQAKTESSAPNQNPPPVRGGFDDDDIPF